MSIHKESKAHSLREYMKANPNLTRQQLAENMNVSLQFVRNVINQDKRKSNKKVSRPPGRPPKTYSQMSLGIKLDGGYYSLAKLKDIVGALETLSKVTNLA